MATSADVENALIKVIVDACYQFGQPPIAQTVSVERGWPTEADVRAAAAAGTQMVSIYAAKGMARDTTATLRSWDVASQPAPTITATVSGNAVTLGGTVTAGNIVAVLVNGTAVTQVATPKDTLTTIAASLASQIGGATASGAVVTCPSAPVANVVNGGTGAMEVSRVDQVFHLRIDATSPDLRDQLLAAIEPALKYNPRYTMPDGSVAMLLKMQATGPNDRPSRAYEWEQTIALTFRYASFYTAAQAAVAATILNADPANGTATSTQSV